MRRQVLRVILLTLVLASPAVRAAVEPLGNGLRRCALDTDATRRLACFDALVNSLPKIQSDQFGMTADIARKRDPVAASRSDSESLTGKIVALREAPRGNYIFTLDGGQIWMQTEPRSSIQFTVGEAVRIEKGSMGSLWLAADHHRKTQVKRVQ